MWLFLICALKLIGSLVLLSIAHILYYCCSPWARKFNKFSGPMFIPLLGNRNAFSFIKIQGLKNYISSKFRFYMKLLCFENLDAFTKLGGFWSYGTTRIWVGWRAFIVTTDLDVVQVNYFIKSGSTWGLSLHLDVRNHVYFINWVIILNAFQKILSSLMHW